MRPIKLIAATAMLLNTTAFANITNTHSISINNKLNALESKAGVKIGVYAIDTNSHKIIAYHANQRFPVQSTLKFMGVAALLKLKDRRFLEKAIHYTKKDLIFWHPVTGRYINSGMTFNALAEAAITYSDNPAINIIIKALGGPKSITAFARGIGNQSFNLVHYEGNLNSNPKNKEDTSTPKDMAINLQKITLGNVLPPLEKNQLIEWMRNSTTGYKRIRSGVPVGWVVADKTGSGNFGIANDIGIVWSPTCKPIILSIYTVRSKKSARQRSDIVADTTNLVLNSFKSFDRCFDSTNL